MIGQPDHGKSTTKAQQKHNTCGRNHVPVPVQVLVPASFGGCWLDCQHKLGGKSLELTLVDRRGNGVTDVGVGVGGRAQRLLRTGVILGKLTLGRRHRKAAPRE